MVDIAKEGHLRRSSHGNRVKQTSVYCLPLHSALKPMFSEGNVKEPLRCSFCSLKENSVRTSTDVDRPVHHESEVGICSKRRRFSASCHVRCVPSKGDVVGLDGIGSKMGSGRTWGLVWVLMGASSGVFIIPHATGLWPAEDDEASSAEDSSDGSDKGRDRGSLEADTELERLNIWVRGMSERLTME